MGSFVVGGNHTLYIFLNLSHVFIHNSLYSRNKVSLRLRPHSGAIRFPRDSPRSAVFANHVCRREALCGDVLPCRIRAMVYLSGSNRNSFDVLREVCHMKFRDFLQKDVRREVLDQFLLFTSVFGRKLR